MNSEEWLYEIDDDEIELLINSEELEKQMELFNGFDEYEELPL